MWVKLDSAIADVPTDKNVSTAGIHQSFMYESQSKRDFDIFWSGCCNITKSSTFYHFLCYKCISLEILGHKHETHSIVCTKCESKEITEKFKVLVIREGTYKIVLKSVFYKAFLPQNLQY